MYTQRGEGLKSAAVCVSGGFFGTIFWSVVRVSLIP